MTTANPYEAEFNKKKAEYERLSLTIKGFENKPMTPEQKALLLQSKTNVQKAETEFLNVKKNYESFGSNPTQDEINKSNLASDGKKIVTQTATTLPAVTTTTPDKGTPVTAPNGKQYVVYSTGDGTYWFDGGYGKKSNFQSVAAAKAEIDIQNPITATPTNGTPVNAAKADVANATDMLKTELSTNAGLDINAWKQLQNNIPDTKIQGALATNVATINNAFKNATNSLQAAKSLQSEVETLYGENQIQAQASDMAKKGLDPAKASQASLFLNLKGRANLSAKVKTLEAEQEKTIANLEMQKAQLLVNAQNTGTENEKWIFDQTKDIDSQIQTIKNNFQAATTNITQTYTLKPLLDVESSNLAADSATIAQQIQQSFDTSTPDRKISALFKALGDSFSYIDNTIYNYVNLPFDQLLIKAAEMVLANKIKATKAMA